MTFAVNDSPYAGRDGDKVQSRVIRDRLEREAEGNVAIRVTESREKDAFEVAGRGELQLGVLIETMRREGYELSISRPRVLYRDGPNGREEPYETVVIDVDDEHAGTVVEKMAQRKGEVTDMRPSGGGKPGLALSAPQRGPARGHARRPRGRDVGAAGGRDDRAAPLGRRQGPLGLLRPLARPHRLSRRVPLRRP